MEVRSWTKKSFSPSPTSRAQAGSWPRPTNLNLKTYQDEYLEVEKAKKKLDINLPIPIGYFILQYAKLHMLQFYYDYLDVYVDRDDFVYCEMDTDSV